MEQDIRSIQFYFYGGRKKRWVLTCVSLALCLAALAAFFIGRALPVVGAAEYDPNGVKNATASTLVQGVVPFINAGDDVYCGIVTGTGGGGILRIRQSSFDRFLTGLAAEKDMTPVQIAGKTEGYDEEVLAYLMDTVGVDEETFYETFGATVLNANRRPWSLYETFGLPAAVLAGAGALWLFFGILRRNLRVRAGLRRVREEGLLVELAEALVSAPMIEGTHAVLTDKLLFNLHQGVVIPVKDVVWVCTKEEKGETAVQVSTRQNMRLIFHREKGEDHAGSAGLIRVCTEIIPGLITGNSTLSEDTYKKIAGEYRRQEALRRKALAEEKRLQKANQKKGA